MFTIVIFSLAILVIIIHIALTKKPRNKQNILEIILLDYFIVAVGIGQTMMGLAHIFNGPEIAMKIGWVPGSPFQSEVGVANIAIGIAALVSPWFRGAYWLAVALVGGIFGVGAGLVHIQDIMVNGNRAVYNAGGGILISDLILPVVLIILVIAYLRLKKK